MSGLSDLPGGVAVLSWQQEYTASHNFKATTLQDAPTIAWDLSSNQVAKVTLSGDRTLANPFYTKDGGVYVLFVIQDGAGSRKLTYGSNYSWGYGLAPILTATPNRMDILTFVSLNGKMYGTSSLGYTV